MTSHHDISILKKVTTKTPNARRKLDKTTSHDLMPTGVLAIHIKRCKNLKIQDGSKAFVKRLPVSVYLRVMIGDVIKTTSVNDVRCSNHNVGVIFDDLKHFLLTVNNKLDDESNKIRFTLMGYQGNGKHKKLAEKEIHLFNVIRYLFMVESIELAKNAHVMGEVEMEMAFSYGCFGYGYSSQLRSKTRTPAEQISQSLFYRAEPPVDRRHDSKDVMTVIPMPYPPFVDWPVQVDIIMGGREFMTESVSNLMSGKASKKGQYPLVLSQMNKRMSELQTQYASFTKRSQRLSFLQGLITTKINPELEENQDELLFSSESGGKRQSEENLEHVHEDHPEYGYENMGILSKIASFFGFQGSKEETQVVAAATSIEDGNESILDDSEVPVPQERQPSLTSKNSKVKRRVTISRRRPSYSRAD